MSLLQRLLPLVLLLPPGIVESAQPPLFGPADSLQLTIEAPFREIIRKRHDKTRYAALVSYEDATGLVTTFPAEVAARGNSRLDACEFPPLKIVFAQAETVNTIFAGQDDLKMVTQCKKGKTGRKWLLQEQGIYRAYGVVTEHSYRVRSLQVTYRDSTRARWVRIQPAFLIEATDKAAERLAMMVVRPVSVRTESIRPTELANYMLLQFLIANTDFSVKKGPRGEGCCHNGRVLATPGRPDDLVILPYDFDQAGIIATNYAIPDERLGIRSVSRRLYRGFCAQQEAIPAAVDLYLERRSEITAALVPDELPESTQARIRRFADGFFNIIGDPAELQTKMTDKCQGAAAFPIRKTTTSQN